VVEHVERNTRSLARRYDGDCRLRVVCAHEAGHADVVVVGRAGRLPIVARAANDNMYKAVDAAFEKALRQSARAHERRVHRRQPN